MCSVLHHTIAPVWGGSIANKSERDTILLWCNMYHKTPFAYNGAHSNAKTFLRAEKGKTPEGCVHKGEMRKKVRQTKPPVATPIQGGGGGGLYHRTFSRYKP